MPNYLFFVPCLGKIWCDHVLTLKNFIIFKNFFDYFAKCSDILPPDEGICEVAEFFFFPQFFAGQSSHHSILFFFWNKTNQCIAFCNLRPRYLTQLLSTICLDVLSLVSKLRLLSSCKQVSIDIVTQNYYYKKQQPTSQGSMSSGLVKKNFNS